jgi:methyl-galactoside transport system ATP-binding protein
MEYVLEMRNICKEFPGVKALDGAQLCVRPGSVHALMGENGAGKSTLLKCLFGIYRKDSGSILIDGREADFKSPADAMAHGVAMVHQELNQALRRNVADNVWLGRYPTRGGFVRERYMQERTRELLESLDMDVDPARIIGTLSVAERQMVEIAKAVSYHARVLVLDEPTSSLTDREVEQLFVVIERLKARGCGIVYVSHKMQEILRISDEVTVMRDGKYISTDKAADLTTDKIIAKMVGRELADLYPAEQREIGEQLLLVEHLFGKELSDISFSLHRGEVLGLCGLVGAGRTEILETLFGMRPATGGRVTLAGRELRVKKPADAIKAGLALLTEERRATGIFAGLSLTDNACVARLKSYRGALGLLRTGSMHKDTDHIIRDLRVRCAGRNTPIKLLSGGNQQKVILGRWLLTEPEVLLLDEPTRGVDVGAKSEIYALIAELAGRGKGVIMVSSEMPELIGTCDRILVVSGGRIAGELVRGAYSEQELMSLAAKYV